MGAHESAVVGPEGGTQSYAARGSLYDRGRPDRPP